MQLLFISIFPNSDTIIFHTNIITIQLILHGLFSALMKPWEKVYTVQHMNSRRTSRRCSRNKSTFKESAWTNLELEDNRSHDGSVTAVDMEEENDIAAVVVIEMEEEGEGT